VGFLTSQISVADQLYAFAAGHQAKALHKAAFVWADSTDADFASTGNDQFLIRASGGVGIGTTSPQQALHVAGDALVRGTNFTAAGHTARLLLGDGNHTLRSEYGGGLRFGVWPDPNALVIQDGSGNVGIGTPAPAGKLHVNGTAGNNTGSWSTFSDRRLKQDIQSMSHGALDQLMRLEGVTFDYTRPELREGYEGVRRGWIAQQVEQVFPEWVSEAPDGMKMVTPVGFNALMVEALRELRAEKDAAIQGLNQKLNQKLEQKETEITELKARLEKLEQLLHSLILKPTH